MNVQSAFADCRGVLVAPSAKQSHSVDKIVAVGEGHASTAVRPAAASARDERLFQPGQR